MYYEIRQLIKENLEREFWGYRAEYHNAYSDYVKTKGFFKKQEILRIPLEKFVWEKAIQPYSEGSSKYSQSFYYYKNDKYKIILFR